MNEKTRTNVRKIEKHLKYREWTEGVDLLAKMEAKADKDPAYLVPFGEFVNGSGGTAQIRALSIPFGGYWENSHGVNQIDTSILYKDRKDDYWEYNNK